ncbi:MAG: prepilin-type N-terminal cleavage/methylation domain-containing protein [Gammaproteobacteria bacterium]
MILITLKRHRGLTLVELLIAGAILALLVAIAMPAYTGYRDRLCVQQAIGDIMEMELMIQRNFTKTFNFPETLVEVGLDGKRDCWNRPYEYLKIAGKKGKGGNRKDRNENPLNSDYDLYSVGKDGQTNQSLRPKVSQDDIIRAHDGGYIGLAADF